MKHCTTAAVAVVLSLSLWSLAAAQQDWELHQSDPNPFCNAGEFPACATTIEFFLPQDADIVLSAWSPDTTFVVRRLIDAVLAHGLYTVMWDGRDENGLPVQDGFYPYILTARDYETAEFLFQDTKTAEVSCATPADRPSWGVLKSMYRAKPDCR